MVEKEIPLDLRRSCVALPTTEFTTDIHCVTRWSRFDAGFRGVHWRELAKLVQAAAGRALRRRARRAGLHREPAARRARGRRTRWSRYEADGEPLDPEHGGPVRLVVPSPLLLEEREVADAASSCVAADQPGFWERYGYHNDADPWKEERYGF